MKIEELKKGDSFELCKSFTEEDIKRFAELSLDTNPIHIDVEYAKKTIYKKPIVHGFLSSSLISAIIGTKLPGPGSIYLNQDLNFKRPIYIGEQIRAVVTIIDIKLEKSIFIFKPIVIIPIMRLQLKVVQL